MKLLLDTHILLWALTGDKKLPEEADKMINSADNVIFYSIISVWETAIKHMRHPEQLAVTPHELEKYCRRAKMKNLVLNSRMSTPSKLSRALIMFRRIKTPLTAC